MLNRLSQAGATLKLGLALGLALSWSAVAGEAEVKALDRLFTEDISEDWLAPIFISQLPPARLKQVLDQVSNGLGDYQGASQQGSAYRADFERGYLPTTIHLDSDGRIDGLFFRPAVLTTDAAGDLKPATGPAAERLAALFTTEVIPADWFSDTFLERVPVSQIQELVGRLNNTLGTYEQSLQTRSGYSVQFSGGSVPAQIRLGDDGRIEGLFFQQPVVNKPD